MASPVRETRLDGRTGSSPAGEHGETRTRRAATALAWLYPLGLLLAMAAFWIIGERWWATAVVMYLPRWGFALPLPLLVLAVWRARAPRTAWVPLAASMPLLLFIAGFVFPWPVHPDPGAPKLRLMSYNVNTEKAGDDAILEQVDRYSPDVLFLVEHESNTILAPLQTRYPSVRNSGQFVVATRFAVTSTFDPEKLSYWGKLRSPRWLQEVIETPLGPIAFYAVHPLSARDGLNAMRGSGLHELKASLGLSFASQHIIAYNAGLRAMQVADFAAAAVREVHPVVIAGDTNLPSFSYVLHHFLSGFHDAFREAGCGFGYTFPVGKHDPWMRIDRIMASDELRFVHFEFGCGTASDHACVVADLQRSP